MRTRHILLAALGILLVAFVAHGQVFGRWNKNDEGSGKTKSSILLSLSLLPPDSECSGTPPDDVTFTRASAATCIDSSGVAHALTTNQARVHSTLGLLVEGSATNAVLHSRDVTAASWSSSGCSQAATGMDGAALVGRCTGPTSAVQSLTVATGARTAGAYVRRQSGTCTVTLSADSESTSKALAGGWERLTLTYTSDGSVTLDVSVGSGCVADIDYVQDEAGSIATSPIVTGGTAAVRAAEVATVSASGLSELNGCAAMDIAKSSGTSVVTYLQINANSVGLQGTATSTSATAFNPPAPVTATSTVASSSVEWVPSRYSVTYSPGALQVFAGATAGSMASGFAGWGIVSAGLNIGSRSGGTFAGVSLFRNLVLGTTPEACQ